MKITKYNKGLIINGENCIVFMFNCEYVFDLRNKDIPVTITNFNFINILTDSIFIRKLKMIHEIIKYDFSNKPKRSLFVRKK